ncbi:MAG: phosphate signaling complex protein PhoU [Methylococcaceae bacterium]
MNKSQDLRTEEHPVSAHTSRVYDEELASLRASVLELGQEVLLQARNSLEAIVNKDVDLARSIFQAENAVNASELEIDARVVATIARRGPVGSDLRLIISVSKEVVDLERIGDEVAKIAGIVGSIFGSNNLVPNHELIRCVHQMGTLAINTLDKAIKIYDALDEVGARELRGENHLLEDAFQDGIRHLVTYVMEDSRNIGFRVNMVLAMKAYERIAAHAHNLAEFVIYQVEGEDVRHSNSQ